MWTARPWRMVRTRAPPCPRAAPSAPRRGAARSPLVLGGHSGRPGDSVHQRDRPSSTFPLSSPLVRAQTQAGGCAVSWSVCFHGNSLTTELPPALRGTW